MITEAQKRCASAGMSLARDYGDFIRKSPTIFEDNLRGLVRKEDLNIQHSELAIHTKAAGKEIVSFFLSPSMAFAIYAEEDGSCGYIYGTDTEVLSPSLIRKVQEMWPVKPEYVKES